MLRRLLPMGLQLNGLVARRLVHNVRFMSNLKLDDIKDPFIVDHSKYLPPDVVFDKTVPEYFGVVEIGGSQHKVMKDDRIMVEKLDARVGEMIQFRKVLLLGTRDTTVIGRPVIKEAVVLAHVEEQTKLAKTFVFKKRRRKGYRRMRGHRQSVTIVKIKDIIYPIEPESVSPADTCPIF